MRRGRVLLLALVIGLLPAIGLLLPETALAAEVTVGQGDYPCSRDGLATAIGNAATSGPDNPGTVTFDCDNPQIDIDEQIEITGNVTIDGGNNGNGIILDGGGGNRIFNIDGDASVTLHSLTLQHGVASAGGAIYNNGTLTIKQSTLTNNEATNVGGAIRNYGTLTINQSTFADNEAGDDGGAILSDDTLTITESRFARNESTEGDGGAIASLGLLTIHRSSFVDNQADDYGGAISVDGGSPALTSSTLTGNTAGVGGSAIYFSLDLDSASISWSTVAQPEDANPGLFIFDIPLTLEGVILTGPDDNCEFFSFDDGATMTTIDSYTLADDASCQLDTSTAGTSMVDTGFEISDLATAPTIYGVEQTYYPMTASSPAADAGGDGCAEQPDQLSVSRYHDTACDIGAVERNTLPHFTDVSPTEPQTIDEGTDVPVTVITSDDELDSRDIFIDCDGVGSRPAQAYLSFGTVLTSCQYLDNGAFTGAIRVTDSALIGNRVTFDVAVTNVRPHDPTLGAPQVASVSQPVSLQLGASDVPADTLSFAYACGNGAGGSVPDVSSSDGTFSATGSCNYAEVGTYTISLTATDDDGGTSDVTTFTLLVADPVDLCANRWDGDLRMSISGRCAAAETLLTLPNDGPLTLCANRWTGEARYSQYGRCRSTETSYDAIGINSVPVCINRWDGELRVGSRCYSTERSDAL